ncbi:MAG: glycosyltransferase family 4 protein [Salibacteraceae bacterium]
MKRKILIVTYYWPPFGGTGVHRILKFAKYLAGHGHEIIILTTKNAFSHVVDENLLNEVPDGITVYRTNIFEPTNFIKSSLKQTNSKVTTDVFQKEASGWKSKLVKWVRLNLFIPDAKIGWYPFAVREGKKIIAKHNPDVILSTSPPPTTSLIAKKLAHWSGIKWLADFRDPWTEIFYLDTSSRLKVADKLNRRMESNVLKRADAIIAVNDGFFPGRGTESKTTVIPNGYDEAELPSVINERSNSFSIRYMGTMRVNDFVPAFFDAVNELYAEHSDLRQALQIDFFGSTAAEITDYFKSMAVASAITMHGYVPRQEASKMLMTATVQLLIIGKSKMQKQIYTTKLFEYIRTGRPVLGLGTSDGSAAQVLSETNCGVMYDHKDKESIKRFILDEFKHWQNGTQSRDVNWSEVEKYNYKALAGNVSEIIQSL